jgi:hypothetical protein
MLPGDQIIQASASFGGRGFSAISDTDVHGGSYYAIKAVGGDVVIDSAVLPANCDGSIDGWTISNGDCILAPSIADLQLSSGKALAYKL